MNKIKFGVLGCASVAKRHVLPAMLQLPSIELVAVASRSVEKSISFAEEFRCRPVLGYEELLISPEINAIYMPLPTGLHFKWAHLALDAGKHLLIEKSLALNITEAKSIVNKARSKGLLIKENYMFEYHSQQKFVRDLINSHVGVVRVFRANFGFPPLQEDNFRFNRELGGGALLDAGGYVLKALKVFFPKYKPQVRASTLIYGKSGVDIAGSAMIDMSFDGNTFTAHVSFGFDHFYQCNVEVWGSKGKIISDRTFTADSKFSPTIRVETVTGVDNYTLPSDNHFANLIEDFSNTLNYSNNYNEDYDGILKQAELQDEIYRLAQ